MLSSLIAERYAKALLRAAQAEKALDEVGAQAQSLAKALTTIVGADAFLADPVATPAQKLEAIQAAYPGGLHPLMRQFLSAVLDMKRESFLPSILAAFDLMLEEAQGRVRAGWGSARPLNAKERQTLEEGLSQRLGREVKLEPYTDEELLGGAVLKVGDTIYDASLRTQLKKLGQLMTQPSVSGEKKTPKPLNPTAVKAKKTASKAPAKKAAKAKPKAKTKAKPKATKATKAGKALADKLFKK